MTEYDSSNTHKATIHGDNGVQITVIRNLSSAQDFRTNALWLRRERAGAPESAANGYWDTYGIEAARELHKNIGIVLDELDDITESAKPPRQTLVEALEGAEVGTRFRHKRSANDGWVVVIAPGVSYLHESGNEPGPIDNEYYPGKVRYADEFTIEYPTY